VETIVGLLEILEASQETINVFDLSARIGKEFGETIAIVKAAEMLDVVDTPRDDVLMTQPGWYFLAATALVRKTLFRHTMMKLRLFQIITSRLNETPDGRIDADVILEELGKLPYDQLAKLSTRSSGGMARHDSVGPSVKKRTARPDTSTRGFFRRRSPRHGPSRTGSGFWARRQKNRQC